MSGKGANDVALSLVLMLSLMVLFLLFFKQLFLYCSADLLLLFFSVFFYSLFFGSRPDCGLAPIVNSCAATSQHVLFNCITIKIRYTKTIFTPSH